MMLRRCLAGGGAGVLIAPLRRFATCNAVYEEGCCDSSSIFQDPDEALLNPLRDTSARLGGYAMSLKSSFRMAINAFTSPEALRYLAYSSDVGEAFRPIAHRCAVTFSYVLSGAYVLGDVAVNGYMEHQVYLKERAEGKEASIYAVGLTVVHSAVFQCVASLLLPYLIIHNAVHVAHSKVFSNMASPLMRRLGPSAVGLCIVPLLPLVDKPVEDVVDYIFDHMVPHKANQIKLEKVS